MNGSIVYRYNSDGVYLGDVGSGAKDVAALPGPYGTFPSLW
jgi:hypothetical protein